jgi:SsrA-binding protein
MADSIKILSENRRARFDYEILDTLVAGVELSGQEVKASKAGQFALAGSRVIIRGGEAFLVGATISPYQAKNVAEGYEADRTRRLLLKKEEITLLGKTLSTKGNAVVPLESIAVRGLVKLRLAIARGRKAADKREYLKRKAVRREMHEQ